MTEVQSDRLAAATGDSAAFDGLVAPHRRELLAHCYRPGHVSGRDDVSRSR